MKAGAPIIGKAFEPNEKGYTVAQLHALYSQNTTVLRGWELNPLPSDYAPSYITVRVGLYHHHIHIK